MIDARSESYIKVLHKSTPFRVSACIVTLVAFFVNIFAYDISWASGPELNPEHKELDPSTFSIPEYLGQVKYSYTAPKSESKGYHPATVIHIQDAHCNYVAQSRIAEIIAYLNKEYGVSTVNLEGGAMGYDLSPFTSISDVNIRKKASDYFVREGLVNGAEYFAINNPGSVRLWGVEDVDLYIKNLLVYREFQRNRADIDSMLSSISRELAALKLKIYSPELLRFDAGYVQYKAGNLPFKDYLSHITDYAGAKKIDMATYRNISLLNNVLREEEGVDFKKADGQKDELVRALSGRLSNNDARTLTVDTMEFKAGRISQTDFYGRVLRFAEKARLDTTGMEALKGYLLYIRSYDSVDRTKILDELDGLDAAIRGELFENDTQRGLSSLSKNLAILKNIFNFTLTRDDYGYYKAHEDAFAVSNFTRFIDNQKGLSPDAAIVKLDRYREKITAFYEYSFKRDEAFVRNMYDRPGRSDKAILITGGFHTENLCELFRASGISYISITPNFTNPEGYVSPYFNLLSGSSDKTIKGSLPAALTAMLAPYSQLNPRISEAVDRAALSGATPGWSRSWTIDEAGDPGFDSDTKEFRKKIIGMIMDQLDRLGYPSLLDAVVRVFCDEIITNAVKSQGAVSEREGSTSVDPTHVEIDAYVDKGSLRISVRNRARFNEALNTAILSRLGVKDFEEFMNRLTGNGDDDAVFQPPTIHHSGGNVGLILTNLAVINAGGALDFSWSDDGWVTLEMSVSKYDAINAAEKNGEVIEHGSASDKIDFRAPGDLKASPEPVFKTGSIPYIRAFFTGRLGVSGGIYDRLIAPLLEELIFTGLPLALFPDSMPALLASRAIFIVLHIYKASSAAALFESGLVPIAISAAALLLTPSSILGSALIHLIANNILPAVNRGLSYFNTGIRLLPGSIGSEEDGQVIDEVELLPAQKPIVDLSVDTKKADEWINSQPEEDGRALARFFIDHLTYVDQRKFEDSLKRSIESFNEACNRDFVVCLLGSGRDDRGAKSNAWVYRIARQLGLPRPKGIIDESAQFASIGEKLVEWLIEHPTVNDIVFPDDASYSGEQLNRWIVDIVMNLLERTDVLKDREIKIHLLMPYMTVKSLTFAQGALDRFQDIARKELGISLNLVIVSHSQEVIPTIDEMLAVVEDPVQREALSASLNKYYGQAGAKTLLYFQHKQPDYLSLPYVSATSGTFLEGPIVSVHENDRNISGYVQFVPVLKSGPYSPGYSRWVMEHISGTQWASRIESPVSRLAKEVKATDSQARLVSQVAREFGFEGDLVAVEFASGGGGLMSRPIPVLITRSGERFAIKRIAKPTTLEGVRFVIDYIRYLKDNGIPVPTISKIGSGGDKAGDYFVEFSNTETGQTEYYSVDRWIEGRQMSRLDATPDELKAVGRMLGRIHALSRQFTENYPLRFSSYDVKNTLAKISDPQSQWRLTLFPQISAEDRDFIESVIDRIKGSVIGSSLDDLGPMHAIASDMNFANIVFDESGQVKAVFDWDNARTGYRIEDFHPILMHSGRPGVGMHTENMVRDLKVLLEGWSETVDRQLSPREKAALPGMLLTSLLVHIIVRSEISVRDIARRDEMIESIKSLLIPALRLLYAQIMAEPQTRDAGPSHPYQDPDNVNLVTRRLGQLFTFYPLLERRLDDLPIGATILLIGPGYGFEALDIMKEYHEKKFKLSLMGVDNFFSDENRANVVEEIRLRYYSKIDENEGNARAGEDFESLRQAFKTADANNPLDYSDKEFDMVIFGSHVMEYIDNRISLIEQVYRVLKPGGTGFVDMQGIVIGENEDDVNVPNLNLTHVYQAKLEILSKFFAGNVGNPGEFRIDLSRPSHPSMTIQKSESGSKVVIPLRSVDKPGAGSPGIFRRYVVDRTSAAGEKPGPEKAVDRHRVAPGQAVRVTVSVAEGRVNVTTYDTNYPGTEYSVTEGEALTVTARADSQGRVSMTTHRLVRVKRPARAVQASSTTVSVIEGLVYVRTGETLHTLALGDSITVTMDAGPQDEPVSPARSPSDGAIVSQANAANAMHDDIGRGTADWIITPTPFDASTLPPAHKASVSRDAARLYKDSETHVEGYAYRDSFSAVEFRDAVREVLRRVVLEMTDPQAEATKPKAILYAPDKVFTMDDETSAKGYEIVKELIKTEFPAIDGLVTVIREAVPENGLIHEAAHIDLGKGLLNYIRGKDRMSPDQIEHLVNFIKTVTTPASLQGKSGVDIINDILDNENGKIVLDVIMPIDVNEDWRKAQYQYIQTRISA